jgi:ubiquinone/menaquinone biosynthesis C-methylase UbiE
VAVDAAPKMTGVTGARAGERGAMVRTVTARFEGLEFEAGAFDLVASCMSLHHVVDKGALYEDVFRWMEPGGVLAVADQIRGATEEVQRVHWEAWLRFCREPEHCSEDEVRSLLEHAAAHDHYTALGEHFRLLAAAGFRGIDCVWRDGMYGVVVAVK